MNLKLDYKKTSKVGLAFAIIILFWNTYDFVIPLLIENAFGLSNASRGAVMGLDNLLSLFMLPLFGKLSDKSTSKYGRRTPFIVLGTIAAVVLMIFIPITANKQLNEANAERDIWKQKFATDTVFRETTLGNWYDLAQNGDYTYLSHADYKIITGKDTLVGNKDLLSREQYSKLNFTPISAKKDGFLGFFGNKVFKINGEVVTKTEYNEVEKENSLYNKYVKTGTNTFISQQVKEITDAHPGRLVAYLFVLFFVLIAMGVFRSPAVALMPDVTPKPLRSQANAIINLAGGIGGALAFLVYTIVLAINPTAYTVVYVLVAGLMLVLLACFCKLVNEPKMVLEKEEICLQYGIAEEEGFDDLELEKSNMVADASNEAVVPTVKMSAEENKKLEKAKLRSFLLILASIFMWFMGYNAVTSNLSVYSTKALGMSAGTAGLISGISMGISAIAFIPVGMLAVKIGRRKSIMIGFLLAVVSFLLIWLFLKPTGSAAILFTIFYLIAGFGLIIANVNTFPMVVELSKAGDVGKYTGFYYMATMSAQAITPFIAGLFMDNITMKSLFAYAAVCVIIAIVLMAFVKHGDSRPLPSKKGKGDKITETEK
ncbi:MAG: MFS transporter [Clostridia bacterium]